MFGRCTKIKTTQRESYPKIDDEPKMLKVENNIKEKLLTGLAIAAVIAGVAIAVVVTGGATLAPLACALGGVAIGTGAVAIGTAVSDSQTGYNRSWEEYLENLMIGGGIGFVAGALVYGAIAAGAGTGASLFLRDSILTKEIVPSIIIGGGIIAGISGCGKKEVEEVSFADLIGSDNNDQSEEGIYIEQGSESDTIADNTSVDDENLMEEESESDSSENPDYVIELAADERRVLKLPETGAEITVSRGIDANPRYEPADVHHWDTWSRLVTAKDYKEDKLYGNEGLFWRRFKYAMENYEYNDTDDDLLIFHLGGKYQQVFAGAMVNGYADIGDIVEVTLDDGNTFFFLIITVKNIEHTQAELAKNQIQCEWGHGYIVDKNKDNKDIVSLNPCEFLTVGDCKVDNVKFAPSGGFLTGRRVVQAETVAHIEIGEYTLDYPTD